MMSHVELDLLPRQLPDLAVAEQLYQAQCSACHGASGHGDGPLATALTPPPTDFSDAQRARERSPDFILCGLFDALTGQRKKMESAHWHADANGAHWRLALVVTLGFFSFWLS